MNPIQKTIAAMCLLAMAPAFAASVPALGSFVGEWKLDPSRSRLTDVMKVHQVGARTYTLDFGVGAPETIVIDGTQQPGMSGSTVSISQERSNEWTVERRRQGRMLLSAHWKLSDKDTVLSDSLTSMSEDGARSTVNYVYHRKGPGTGFAGTWVSTSEAVDFAYLLQIRSDEGSGLTIVDSTSQITRSMKADGKDYPNSGANAALVATSSIRMAGENMLLLTDKKADGTVYDTRDIKLSADGKALTMTVHLAGRDEPNVLVFARQ